jgi:hypothetical protein
MLRVAFSDSPEFRAQIYAHAPAICVESESFDRNKARGADVSRGRDGSRTRFQHLDIDESSAAVGLLIQRRRTLVSHRI